LASISAIWVLRLPLPDWLADHGGFEPSCSRLTKRLWDIGRISDFSSKFGPGDFPQPAGAKFAATPSSYLPNSRAYRRVRP